MAFNGNNMTPLGGNSRAGVAPMGWSYQSSVDAFATVTTTGYFDTFNMHLLAGQFIYVTLTDGKSFLTIASVDKVLKQVQLDSVAFFPGTVAAVDLSSPPPIGDVLPNTVQAISFEALAGVMITEFSTDETLGGDSDETVPTEQAVKRYVDAVAVDLSSPSPIGDVLPNTVQATSFKASTGVMITEFSTDETLGGDSEEAVPTEQAVKRYVDGLVRNPVNLRQVVSKSDFPPPSSGVITLETNLQYSLYDTVDLDTDRLVLPPGSINILSSTVTTLNNLLYAGDEALLSGVDVALCVLERSLYSYTEGGTGSIFDVDGGVFQDTARFFAFRHIFLGFTSIGTVKNFELVNLETIRITNCGNLILENNNQIAIQGIVFDETGSDPLTLIQIVGEKSVVGHIANGAWQIGDNQAAMFIDPNIGADSRISILQIEVDKAVGGEFFQSGETGGITAITNMSSNGSITTIVEVETSGENQQIDVFTDGLHTLYIGEEVIQATGVANYDVPTNILSLPAGNIYRLDIPYEGDASGTFMTNTVRLDTAVAHGFSDNETLLIKDTIYYNGGAKIYGVSASSFRIKRVYVQDEVTGSYDTGSLTGSDPRVNVFQVQGEKDSKAIFNFGIEGNTTATTIAVAQTYGDLNFTGATPLTTATERFTVVNAVTGEFRYEGMEAVSLMISGFAAAVTASNEVIYSFVPAINGVSQEASVTPSIFQVKTTIDNAFFSGALILSPGDLIKMQIKTTEMSVTDEITIINYSFVGE